MCAQAALWWAAAQVSPRVLLCNGRSKLVDNPAVLAREYCLGDAMRGGAAARRRRWQRPVAVGSDEVDAALVLNGGGRLSK